MTKWIPAHLILVVVLSVPFSACLNNSNTDDCDPNLVCNTVQPTNGAIDVSVTINSDNPYVPMAIYYGNASDSNLYFEDTVFSDPRYYLPIGKRYSIVAKYRQRGNTVYAVDGGKTTYTSTTNCGETCYEDDILQLNLKLID
jgi:hypothetical protein